MRKKPTNDQQDIIEAIKNNDYAYVWERVKQIGYKDVPDVHERYMFFHKAFLDFDPLRNNNFIHFYKTYLNYLRFDRNSTFRVTEDRANIRRLKEQSISPTKDAKKIIKDLSNWNN
jgi:hypothetical protein